MKLSTSTPVSQFLLYALFAAYLLVSIGLAFHISFVKSGISYLFLFSCLVFFIFQPVNNLRFLLAFCGTALIIFFGEWLALKTGWVVGNFRYGHGLGAKLLGIPWAFVLTWAALISASVIVVSAYVDNRWGTTLLASLLVVLIYFLIERSAAGLNFWYFKNGAATLHAYAGRFALSGLAAICFVPALKTGNAKSGWTLIGLLTFLFGVLAIVKEI